MSEPKSSVSNLLRQYRFKKSSAATTNGSEDQIKCKFCQKIYLADNFMAFPFVLAAVELQPVPGKRRIHVANDSSSDEANSPTKAPEAKYQQLLSVKDREELLVAVKKQEPEYDTMVMCSIF